MLRISAAALAVLAAAAEAQTPLGTTLQPPDVLEDRSPAPDTVEVVLTAERARLSLLPHTGTTVWAYNGSVPGPTRRFARAIG